MSSVLFCDTFIYCVYTTIAQEQRSEGTLKGGWFYPVHSGDCTQIVMLGSKSLYPLGHPSLASQ